jgi:hypothetical protein
MTAMVRLRTTFSLLSGPTGPRIPLQVGLTYDSRDPFAVMTAITTRSGDLVVWELSRDLLAAGLRRPVGLGDVLVRPSGRDEVIVELRSSSRSNRYAVSRRELVTFLDDVYTAVPCGRECDGVDVDAELRALTRGGER